MDGMEELINALAEHLTEEDVIVAEAEARGYVEGWKEGFEDGKMVAAPKHGEWKHLDGALIQGEIYEGDYCSCSECGYT